MALGHYPAVFLFLCSAAGLAHGHGGIYISRVYTSAAGVDLVPPYGMKKGDIGLNVSGFYGWTWGRDNNSVVGTSDIRGQTGSAAASWAFADRFALSFSAAGMAAQGLEPRREIPISAEKEYFQAAGFTALGAVSAVAVRRRGFEFPVMIGAGKLWIRSRKNNPQEPGGVIKDYWNTPAIVWGFAPRYQFADWLLAAHVVMRRTPEAHERIKPLIASGQHGKQDFMDPNLGFTVAYQPWGLGVVYTLLRDSVQSAGLRWSRRW